MTGRHRPGPVRPEQAVAAAVGALQMFGVSNRVEARVLLGLWQRAAGWPATRRALLARWLQGPRLSPAQVEQVVAGFARRECDRPTAPAEDTSDGFGFSRDPADPPRAVVPDDCLLVHYSGDFRSDRREAA